MRVTSKGQVTIPIEIRERFGLLPESEVEFEVRGNVVVLHKVRGSKARGKLVVDTLRGTASAGWTTEKILALTRDSK